jgi:SAM-dependent methyltransferase
VIPLYELLRELARAPEPFAIGGPHELWTDPHVQQQLLACHLDADVAAASREHAFIDRSLGWIVANLDVGPATRVLDLGCGPGLYANPLAAHGAHVHGIDLSRASVEEARRRACSDRATFEVGDYLTAPLPEHDLALLIYCDYCALSPGDRRRLLERVRTRMVDGGHLVVDLHSEQRFATLTEACTIADRLMDGFWAPGEYVGVHQTILYPEERVALDRYVVVEPERTRTVHAWLAHLTVDAARAELHDAGFRVVDVLGDVAGAHFDPAAPEYALLAAPA